MSETFDAAVRASFDALVQAALALRSRVGDPLAAHTGWQSPQTRPALSEWPVEAEDLVSALKDRLEHAELRALAPTVVGLAAQTNISAPQAPDPFSYVMF